MEVYKSLKNFGYSDDEVSNKGNVRDIKTGKERTKFDDGGGYVCVSLKRDGQKKYRNVSVHRLVALAFIPNTENKPTVDHINRDKADNTVENLRWFTHSEQNNNKDHKKKKKGRSIYQLDVNTNEIIKKWDKVADANEYFGIKGSSICDAIKRKGTAKGFKWLYSEDVEMDNEEWTELPLGDNHRKYYASKSGKIKKPSGEISTGTLNKHGYVCISISDKDGNETNYQMHRLIAMTYLKPIEGKNIVNHINGDKTDNRLENLEYLDESESMLHAIRTGLIKPVLNHPSRSKAVIQLSLDDEKIKEYPNAKEAHRQTGISHSNIVQTCNGKNYYKSAGGFKWIYA